jgi:hypothetical protein
MTADPNALPADENEGNTGSDTQSTDTESTDPGPVPGEELPGTVPEEGHTEPI